VPTFLEKGLGIPQLANWRGYAVPKNVPDDAVKILHDIIKKAMEKDTFKNYMVNSNLAEAYLPPEEFTASFQEQYITMGKILDELGLNK
jgi:tripartite-type tricarboxylate transporter receptor subunit TctC